MPTDYEFDFLVYIGRFRPYHEVGHGYIIGEAEKRARHLILLNGSHRRPRTTRNPWNFSEVKEILTTSLSPRFGGEAFLKERLILSPVLDILYQDEKWAENVRSIVSGIVSQHPPPLGRKTRIGIIGCNKDHTTDYLRLFPQWRTVLLPVVPGISSSRIRDYYFSADRQEIRRSLDLSRWSDTYLGLDANTARYLSEWIDTEHYEILREEWEYTQKYRKAWDCAPYAPTMVTADTVVRVGESILLIERGNLPGKGLWALPGGFLNQNETLIHAALRELKEETNLDLGEGDVQHYRVFDSPTRDSRGRVITHAFLFNLGYSCDRKIKGGDDAKRASLVPLSEISSEVLYADHYDIISLMLNET